MIKNKFFIFIILVLALLSISVASAEDSSLVNTTDSEVSVCDESVNDDNEVISVSEVDNSNVVNSQLQSNDVKNFDDLKSDIDAKSNNSVLDLDCDYKYNGTSNFDGITINKNNFTIDGHGHTIDANAGSNSVKIFAVSGNNITLKNLILINANFKDKGAVIYNSAGLFFHVSNCTFINNTAKSYGGVIYNSAENFAVSNSSFINNTASRGGVIYNSGANFTVSNSSFTNNKAVSTNKRVVSWGGVICNSGKNFTVSGSSFINNTVTQGGAIRNSAVNFRVSNSSFINNTADHGGAIYNAGAANFTVGDSSFINNTADSGGGIWSSGASCIVSNSSFINNTASYGGAIYHSGSVNFTVSNCSFINNTAKGDGGGAIRNSGAMNFTVSNSEFINNTAPNSDGGAIYNYAAGFTITNSSFINNTASDYGGAIRTSDAGFMISNSSFIDNNATYGGAIYNNGASCTVSNTTFTNNTATQGVAIYNNDGGSINLTNNEYSEIVGGKTYIYNEGIILSPVIITVLGNSTINVLFGQKIVLFATITADGASVGGKTLTFNINNTNCSAITNDDGNYTYNNYTVDFIGVKGVNATYAGVSNITVQNGAISSKYPTGVNITVVSDKIVYGENATFDVNVTSGASGNVTVSVDGIIYNTFDLTNSKTTLNITGLSAGEHKITVNYNGDDDYYSSSSDITVNVNQSTPTIDISTSAFVYGETGIIKVTVNKYLNGTIPTGNVTITINGKKQNVTLTNGVAELSVSGLTAGQHTVEVSYNGDKNYTSNSTSAIFDVAKASSKVDVSAENATIIVKLPNDATGDVNVTIGNETFSVLVENGTAKVNIKDLPAGDYKITVTYTGDGNYNSTVINKTITVLYGVNLTVNDVVMIYKDGSRLCAVLLDAQGNAIVNATIVFAINGVIYNRTTDANGSASIALNLNCGTYGAVILYAGDKNYNASSVNATVTVNTSIIGNDLVKMYQNGTEFYGTFLGTDGNPLANTTVRFNINGVFYNRTTDKNGTAKLNINLNPGNYTLTAYNPNGEEKGFNVLVKSLIETTDLTKYYRNDSSFEAKIYNKDGSIGANQTVTFNVNGVVYTRTADENGTVKLAINLNPRNYTITTMYEGLSVGNNVEVLPTLETSDLSMTYGDGSVFTAKTLDSQGNPLANQNVTFNVNGVVYVKNTNNDGVAKLNINLMKGQYIITSMWNDFQIGNKISIS